MSFIEFESGTEKERIRQELRNVREELLKRAQKHAEKRAERKVAKKLRGDDDWILPSVLSKIQNESENNSSKRLKKSKKEKKSKKPKKEKNRKKKKKKHSSNSDDSSSEEEIIKKKKSKRQKFSDSSCSDESENSDEWVEQTKKDVSRKADQSETPIVREDWMTESFQLKTYSKEQPEKKERQNIGAYDPSKCSRELNPYWKDGGTGLPSFQKPKDDYDRNESTNESTPFNSKNYEPRGNWRKKDSVRTDLRKPGPPLSSSSHRASDSSSSTGRSYHGCEVRHPIDRATNLCTETRSKRESSSSSSDCENESKPKSDSTRPDQMNFLTDQQMNELGAKLVKAEIMGNTELAKELNLKLSKARELRNNVTTGVHKLDNTKPPKPAEEEHILLTTTDNKGITRPLPSKNTTANQQDYYGGRNRKRGGTKTETHVGGERVRYFPDDDRYDIKQMFEREKYTSAQDFDAQFAEIAGQHKNPKDDLEDIFADKVRKGMSDYDKDEKEQKRAIREHEQFTKMLDTCDRCFDSGKMEKQLIVCMGATMYLALPYHEALQPGHCLISPIQHISCSTQLDEDSWSEINDFRSALTRMFQKRSQDVVFFETARYLNRRPHMAVHCIPSKKFEMAPFYFKKAIQESEQMWSTNKQLISLKDTNLRRAIPKGLPYFWVNFGMNSGFAHVIEDQERFPANFAQEIIGGLLNLDTKLWRKPRREHNPIPKVKQFADWWKEFDFTNN